MFRKIMFGVLFFILLSLLVMPVAAQEVITDEPGSTVVVVTDQPPLEEAPTIIESPDSPVVILPPQYDPEVIRLTWASLSGLIAIILVVGLSGGFVGAITIIRAIRNDKPLMLAMEKLYLSSPPALQEGTKKVVELADEATELAKELTDGVLPDATNTA